MPRADYAHWNEEQDRVWWEEEGKHEQLNDPDDESWRDEPDEWDYDDDDDDQS